MPYAIRPWQHVLDCLFCYLYALNFIANSGEYISVNFNVGPQDLRKITVLDICKQAKKWFPRLSYNLNTDVVAESKFLLLDSMLLTKCTAWKPLYNT